MPDERYARRWDVDGYEAVDTAVLVAMPFEYPVSNTEVEYTDSEFTSVCPWTGLPDFGTLDISYRPAKKLVELKSLKYYLHSFRNVGILQEHVVNRIREDLVRLLEPRSLEVAAEFNPRGGLSTRVRTVYEREEP